MKQVVVTTAFILLLTLCALPATAADFVQSGEASWYGSAFHGQTTASGETYNMYELTAAHKFLPLGTKVKVINLDNGKTLTVRVNDRGPYIKGRIIDLSKAAARELGMHDSGTANVRIETVQTAPGVTAKGDLQGIFFVHVATFSAHDPAMKLFERLQKVHSEPRLLQITDPEGFTAHVQLGPFSALSDANGALERQADEFPEAYVMAELEGASLRSYLRANGQEKAASRLAARQQEEDMLYAAEVVQRADVEGMLQTAKAGARVAHTPEEDDSAPDSAGPRRQKAAELPQQALQGLAPCGFSPDSLSKEASQQTGHFVQLAMYNLQRNAVDLLQQIEEPELPQRIVRTDVGQRSTYMVQIGPFPSRHAARERLGNFTERFRDAFVLPGDRMDPEDCCVLQASAGQSQKG